jgi:hypothetical protein
MTSPDRDVLTTYGSPYANYQPVVDPTVDADAGAYNKLAESVAQMTQTKIQAWARIQTNNTSAPTLLSHWALWGNAPGVAPVPTWSATGTYLITWPTTVNDGIQSGQAGFTGPHTVNMVSGWGSAESGTFWQIQGSAASNIATVYAFDHTLVKVDSTGLIIIFFVI